MGVHVGKPTTGTIIHVVGFCIAFIGAIIAWAESDIKTSGDLDYVISIAAIFAPLFLIAASLVGSFEGLQIIGIAIIVYSTALFVGMAQSIHDGLKGVKGRDDIVAGYSLLVIGLWICALGVIPIHDPGMIQSRIKSGLSKMSSMVAVIGMCIMFLGCILVWAYHDAINFATTTLMVSIWAFCQIFIAGTAIFGQSEVARTMALTLGGYILLESLQLAIDLGNPKKSLGKAAGTILWIGEVVLILAMTVLPGVLDESTGGAGSSSSKTPTKSAADAGPVPATKKVEVQP